jgi:hypothetical protein
MGTSASSACLKAPRPYLAPSRPLQLRETRLFVRFLTHFPGIPRSFETRQGRPRRKVRDRCSAALLLAPSARDSACWRLPASELRGADAE